MQLNVQKLKLVGMSALLVLQRAPNLPIEKQAAALFGRLVSNVWAWRVTAPTLAGVGSYHSLSAATTYIVSTDSNPASGSQGESFSFGFYAAGNHQAQSYKVSNLPSGLSYNNNIFSPLISGTLPSAGTYSVSIKGYEHTGYWGASTPVYTLTINVAASNTAPVLTTVPTQDTEEGIPIVVTLSATDLEGDTITFSALSDTLLVSTSVSGNQLTLTPTAGWDGTATITVTANDGNGGTDTTTFILDVTPALGLWKGATVLSGNWKRSNWFGAFYDNSDGWIFHQHHGWMYTSGTDEAGLWLYDSDLGWLYTGSGGIYPYMYRASSQTWLYVQAGSEAPVYWEYTGGQWVRL